MKMSTRKLSKGARQEFWEGHFKAYKDSGLTIKDYCKHNNLSLKSFKYWEQKYSKDTATNFIPVRITPIVNNDKGTALSLKVGEDYDIEIRDGFNPVTQNLLLKTLEQV